MEGHVTSHNEHGITTIEFYHPQSNSLPGHLLEKISQELHFGCAHDSKVIILKSAGTGAFCAGASFDELMAIKDETEGKNFFMGFANVINSIRKCNKIVIGRIQGKCVGGGVGLAAACDYALAMSDSEIKLSELSIGIGPFVVGPAVERKIGKSAFSQLSIDATTWRNADWAKKKGLFAETHETIENLDESVYRLANTLAHSSPEAMAELKNVFWKGSEDWDLLLAERAAISGRLVLSEFSKKAIEGFKPKKK